jgi:O-acetyl-ADP-ribose deacetylase (regulator of RNase III)
MLVRVGRAVLVLLQGDITLQDTEAIVNAANSELRVGGGVDGAIHRAGGPQILAECDAIRRERGVCPPGQAVLTGAGRLKARYVIHAVGPVWSGGHENEDALLCSAYAISLRLAAEHGAASVAFPSISTGAYGFPVERAARLAVGTVRDTLPLYPGIREVRFVTFSPRDYAVFAELFRTFGDSGANGQTGP